MRGKLAVAAYAVILGNLPAVPAEAQEGPRAIDLADQGYLYCVRPNERRKTCRAIETFERLNEGVYGSTSLIAGGNGVSVEMYAPVWLVEDAFCGAVREQDVMSAILRVNGREVGPQAAAPALHQMLELLRPFIDREACTRYEPSGADFVARTTFDGVHLPEFDEPVKVISPTDGYRLAL
jgi:hypothetical protein